MIQRIAYFRTYLLTLALTVFCLGTVFGEGKPVCLQHEYAHYFEPDWGFFAHKRINRLAVLTLPPEMAVFFKPNLDFLSDHAADPDMRRYAVSWEAPRHFIDLDEYETGIDSLPKTWPEALQHGIQVWALNSKADTVLVYDFDSKLNDSIQFRWNRYINRQILPRFTLEDKSLEADSLKAYIQGDFSGLQGFFYTEDLTQHGILPWHLQVMYRRLIAAFRANDGRAILKNAGDIGHYIGDAHVPLHTSSNYNGQKTGQRGIHGFWESRVPELFADEQYDYFVGKPNQIGNPATYFWSIIKESHFAVDSVLNFEMTLRSVLPSDQQMCNEMRGNLNVRVVCRDFAAAYQDMLHGMVERRMRESIHAVASVWYSAWVEAGIPDLSKTTLLPPSADEQQEEKQTVKMFGHGKIIGRPEEH